MYSFRVWRDAKIPKLVVKNEDLIGESERVLGEIMSFIEERDVKCTETGEKIKERLRTKGMSSTFLDKPRTSGSKVNKFSKEQLLN
jgi:hypothetical protein